MPGGFTTAESFTKCQKVGERKTTRRWWTVAMTESESYGIQLIIKSLYSETWEQTIERFAPTSFVLRARSMRKISPRQFHYIFEVGHTLPQTQGTRQETIFQFAANNNCCENCPILLCSWVKFVAKSFRQLFSRCKYW